MPTKNFKVGEMIHKRTPNSKTWINFDGTYTTEIYTDAVHYEDEYGILHNINTDLYDEADFDIIEEPVSYECVEGFKQARTEAEAAKTKMVLNRNNNNFRALKVPFDVQIPRNFQRGYSIGKSKDRLTFIPIQTSPSYGEVNPNNRNTITYQDVWNDTDVELKILPNGLKETLWLKTDKSPTTFKFEVKGLGELSELKLFPAWLRDASGIERDVDMIIDGKILTLSANVEDLVYPIEIDPTVIIQESRKIKDITISNQYPDSRQSTLSVGRYGNDTFYSLLDFDISEIPLEAIIEDANLGMYAYGLNGSTPSIGIYQIISQWDKETVSWNTQPTIADEPESILSPDLLRYTYWNVTDSVQKTVDGNGYGFLLKSDDVDQYASLISFDNSSSENPPKLEITYVIPPTKSTLIKPNGGETWNSTHTMTWAESTSVNSNSIYYDVQLSTDNGLSWKFIGTSISGTSYEYDFINELESQTCLVRVRAYDGTSYSEWDTSDGIFTIRHNLAPQYPTNLSPNGVSRGKNNTIRLSWQYNDPNNDTQSKFDIQWRLQGNLIWNVVSQTVTNHYYDVPANTFPDGIIEWRVRTYDQEGLSSPYSEIAVFTAGDLPSGVTITYPSMGEIVPISNPVIMWSSIEQFGYHIRVLDSSFNLLWENQIDSLNKAASVQYNLENNTNYHIQVAIKNKIGLWSHFSTVQFTVSYEPPATPELILSSEKSNASISVVINNPEPTFPQPDIESIEIYRRKSGELQWELLDTIESNETSYIDYTCPTGLYEYSLIANGENGTRSNRSEYQSVNMDFDGWWVVDQDNGLTYQFLYNVPSQSISLEEERYEFTTFSSKPLVRYGNLRANRSSLTGWVIPNKYENPREQVLKFMDMISQHKPFILKNHFGDCWTVNVHSPVRSPNPLNYEELSIEWVEV